MRISSYIWAISPSTYSRRPVALVSLAPRFWLYLTAQVINPFVTSVYTFFEVNTQTYWRSNPLPFPFAPVFWPNRSQWDSLGISWTSLVISINLTSCESMLIFQTLTHVERLHIRAPQHSMHRSPKKAKTLSHQPIISVKCHMSQQALRQM